MKIADLLVEFKDPRKTAPTKKKNQKKDESASVGSTGAGAIASSNGRRRSDSIVV